MGRRRGVAAAVIAVAAITAACTAYVDPPGRAEQSATHASVVRPSPGTRSGAPVGDPPPAPAAPWDGPLTRPTPGALQPGSDPAALPGDVLIADKLNNRLIIVDPHGRIRWAFPRPGDLPRGQTFLVPDDAFFSPDGRYIVATEEDDFVIRVIDVAAHRIVYQYGQPGRYGSGPNQLWNPDDAVMLPGGRILSADIKNQRLVLIGRWQHTVARQWGETGVGYHRPPADYGAPNGALPIGGGYFLVTEIRGDWVDAVDLNGHVLWSAHPPGVAYPSDSNQIAPDRYLTVDYSSAGQIVVFDRRGRAVWRFRPGGTAALNHPSLALPLPNGDIICTDDMNHRIIVVNPRTNRIVWQYGHTGAPGKAAGYLDNPDGLDLVPPYSLAHRMLMHRR